jgi:hypothetical protein
MVPVVQDISVAAALLVLEQLEVVAEVQVTTFKMPL